MNDIVKHAKVFEELVYLLLIGELPLQYNLKKLQVAISKGRYLPDKLKTVLELMDKNTHPMVVLRTSCSFLGALEPETKEND
jgi:2-methylcitrate synthase